MNSNSTPRLGGLITGSFCAVLVASSIVALSGGVDRVAVAAPPPASGAVSTAPAIDWAAISKAIDAFVAQEQARTGGAVDMEALRAKSVELLAGIDLATLDVAQLERGWSLINRDPAMRQAGLARFAVLAEDRGLDGAQAAMSLAQRSRGESPETVAANVKAALDHPGVEQLFESRGLRSRMQAAGMISALPEDERAPYVERVIEWSAAFTPEAPMGDLRMMSGYAMTLRDMQERMPDTLSRERFNDVRTKLVVVAIAAAEKAESDERAEDAKAMRTIAKRLDSAAMRGELIDGPAPALTFEWIEDSGGTPQWKSLEDLKGKVVILDFWATWCGPCVASFPNIKELRAHYSPEDLVIIGVTSLQGSHNWPRDASKPDRERKVETKGNPDLERELMAEYMKELGLTWTVAFTAEEVFNPEYDVNGIPHLAIIDREGRIRHNGLHPAMPMDEKKALIDPLVKGTEAAPKTQ